MHNHKMLSSNQKNAMVAILPELVAQISALLSGGQSPLLSLSLFSSQIPVVFQTHVHDIFHLDGDGNCGFRCMLEAMEYGENGWFWVQHELEKEMGENLCIYSRVIGG
ncbi:uncharacterized protein VP01_1800g9 [Puccinia sorghi]|uniref:OTU domain-containing protein n=1 Tax=Puccinia sorghi TaxID=27349 RepID=A0A0L6VG64_9BASI|nr:uncharacterized protein VP01_1800g9 [Puccinia sorghi]